MRDAEHALSVTIGIFLLAVAAVFIPSMIGATVLCSFDRNCRMPFQQCAPAQMQGGVCK